MPEVADWNLGWEQSKLRWEESCRKMKEVAEQLTVSLGQTVEELKKLREEREALDSEITKELEEPKQESVMMEEQQKNVDQETQKETHQEFKCKICSTNSEFSGGKNQFSTLEFRFIDGFCFSEDTSSNFVHNGMGELMENRFYPIDIVMNSFGETSINPLGNSGAYEMFVEMPNRKLNCGSLFLHHDQQLMGQSNRVFDPGEIMTRDSKCYGLIFVPVLLDPIRVLSWNWSCYADIAIADGEPIMVPFDRGKLQALHSYFCWEMQSNEIVFNFGIFKRNGCVFVLVQFSSVLVELKGVSSRCVHEHSIILKLSRTSASACAIFVVKPRWKCKGITRSSLVLETNEYVVEFMVILLPCDGGKLKIIIVAEEDLKYPYDRGKTESLMTVVNAQSVDSRKLNFDVNAEDCECFKDKARFRLLVFDPGGEFKLLCV